MKTDHNLPTIHRDPDGDWDLLARPNLAKFDAAERSRIIANALASGCDPEEIAANLRAQCRNR
jgi:hypothetical protein